MEPITVLSAGRHEANTFQPRSRNAKMGCSNIRYPKRSVNPVSSVAPPKTAFFSTPMISRREKEIQPSNRLGRPPSERIFPSRLRYPGSLPLNRPTAELATTDNLFPDAPRTFNNGFPRYKADNAFRNATFN